MDRLIIEKDGGDYYVACSPPGVDVKASGGLKSFDSRLDYLKIHQAGVKNVTTTKIEDMYFVGEAGWGGKPQYGDGRVNFPALPYRPLVLANLRILSGNIAPYSGIPFGTGPLQWTPGGARIEGTLGMGIVSHHDHFWFCGASNSPQFASPTLIYFVLEAPNKLHEWFDGL